MTQTHPLNDSLTHSRTLALRQSIAPANDNSPTLHRPRNEVRKLMVLLGGKGALRAGGLQPPAGLREERTDPHEVPRPSARDMGRDLADRFVGMYVNHWTLDYGDKGRESIRRFLARGQAAGLVPRLPELEFVT